MAILEKAVAFCPIAETSCGFSKCALLARLAKAAALLPIAAKTFGSAEIALIA